MNPVNGPVRHVRWEVVVLPPRHADDRVVLGDDRIVLPARAAEEPPEIVEAERVWPAVERSARPLLIVGCEVPLAERRGAVAVALEDFGHTSGVFGPSRVV